MNAIVDSAQILVPFLGRENRAIRLTIWYQYIIIAKKNRQRIGAATPMRQRRRSGVYTMAIATPNHSIF